MKKIICILCVAALLSISSCKNYIPYTDVLRGKHGWEDEQIRKIQFYLSGELVLQRELKDNSSKIVHGKIKTVNDKKIEEIIIPKRTPGVVAFLNREGRMDVSFEISDEYALSFSENPNDRGKKFSLLAMDWKGKIGKIAYGEEIYSTQPNAEFLHLLVNIKKVFKEDYTKRIASGRKVK